MPTFRYLFVTAAILLLVGCTSAAPNAPVATSAAARPPSSACPSWPTPKLRSDLPRGSLDTCGQPIWPRDGGFNPPKLNVIVQPGELLDRFGDDHGNYLSPRGAPYEDRALPYVCQGYAYTVYRVVQPMPALLGTATPAFGEPGGAIQLQTVKRVSELVAAGVLQPLPPADPAPCKAN